MARQTQSQTLGWKCLAALLFLGNAVVIAKATDFDALRTALYLLVGGLGLAAAIGIWKRASWRLSAYALWLACALALALWRDMELEAVFWKLALGLAIPAALWIVIGYALYRDWQRDDLDQDGRQSLLPHC